MIPKLSSKRKGDSERSNLNRNSEDVKHSGESEADSENDEEESLSDDGTEDEQLSNWEYLKRWVLGVLGLRAESESIDLHQLGKVDIFFKEYAQHLDHYGYEEIKQATALGKKLGMTQKQRSSFFRTFCELDNTRRGNVGVKQLCLHLSIARTPLIDWILGFEPYLVRTRLNITQLLMRLYLFCTLTIDEMFDYEVEIVYLVKKAKELYLADVILALVELNYGVMHEEQRSLINFILASEFFEMERQDFFTSPLSSAEAKNALLKILLFYPVLAYPAMQAHRQLTRRFLSAADWKELRLTRVELKLNPFFLDPDLEEIAVANFYEEKTGARRTSQTRTMRFSPFTKQINQACLQMQNSSQSPRSRRLSTSLGFSSRRSTVQSAHEPSGLSPKNGNLVTNPQDGDVEIRAFPVKRTHLQDINEDQDLEVEGDEKIESESTTQPRRRSFFGVFAKKERVQVLASDVLRLLETGINAWTISATSLLCFVCVESFAEIFEDSTFDTFMKYYKYTLKALPSNEALMGLHSGYVRPQGLRNIGYSVATMNDASPHPLFAQRTAPQRGLSGVSKKARKSLFSVASTLRSVTSNKTVRSAPGSITSNKIVRSPPGSITSNKTRPADRSLAPTHRSKSTKRSQAMELAFKKMMRREGYGEKFIDFILLVSGLLKDLTHMQRLQKVMKEHEPPDDGKYWKEFDDDLRGRSFCYNMRTGDARWEVPEDMKLWQIQQQKLKEELNVLLW